MLISSFAEVVSLGAVVPFVGVLTQPEIVFRKNIDGRLRPARG